MTFKGAVEVTPHLGAVAFHKGIQALAPADRDRIECATARNLSGSVNLDATLRPHLPNANRWDYAVGYRRGTDTVFWIEVHPASQGAVSEVQNKFNWLTGWLASDGKALRSLEARFVWISSGKTTFTPGSPAIRRLAQQGVQTVGRVLRLS